MEADVAKGRRDWAFSERDKVVLERESIRTLCDKLRRERDRYDIFLILYSSPPLLRYPQLSYFRSYTILNWVQKNSS